MAIVCLRRVEKIVSGGNITTSLGRRWEAKKEAGRFGKLKASRQSAAGSGRRALRSCWKSHGGVTSSPARREWQSLVRISMDGRVAYQQARRPAATSERSPRRSTQSAGSGLRATERSNFFVTFGHG